ncbi:MAG: hypothetical protein HZA89_01080 [Verrucomicrobia bacterium]|nr:hypothetical protein [Verrucomicrobiota bacterium]
MQANPNLNEPPTVNLSSYAVGQAVFVRTDTVDYEEKTIAFSSLEELVKVCSEPHPNMLLEKIIIHSLGGGEPSALTLGFISCTKGQRPGNPAKVGV